MILTLTRLRLLAEEGSKGWSSCRRPWNPRASLRSAALFSEPLASAPSAEAEGPRLSSRGKTRKRL